MLVKNIRRYDIILLLAALFLSSIGLSTLYSIGAGRGGEAMQFFNKQLIFFSVLLPAALLVSFIHYNFFRSTSAILYIISLLSLASALFFGDIVRGTKGWLSLGPLTFQPVELAKISLILVLAAYFSKYTKQVNQFRHIFTSGIITALPAGLVMLQPDIGSASILFFIWCTMILASRISKKNIIMLFILGSLAMLSAWFFILHDYQKARVITFLKPASDMRDRGYNVRQAIIAIGSGRFFGKGLGSGSQGQLRFLPEAQTDFIFSVIAEEMGLFGVFLILGTWAIFFLRIFALIKNSSDDFSQFALFGMAMLFIAHVAINIGGNVGLLPLTGIVLPFASYGGSALFMAFSAFGIAQSIRIHAPRIKAAIDSDMYL